MTVEQTTAAYPSTFPMLQGKVALVTGAGSGIGRAGAMAMARHGAQVVVTDLDADKAAEKLSRIWAEKGCRPPRLGWT